MDTSGLFLLTAAEVADTLVGCEPRLVDLVRSAYLAHAEARDVLPPSSFLPIPGRPTSRIIALPAYLGADPPSAGVKWIASFPENRRHGLDRASAVIVINSLETGRPMAVLEGATISAQRTAAAAALAAGVLHPHRRVSTLGVIGAGRINFETARFLRGEFPDLRTILAFDTDRDQVRIWTRLFQEQAIPLIVEEGRDRDDVLRRCELVSFATTAVEPHVLDLSISPPGSTLLHVSLRDISAGAIQQCDNVVDDPEHVCQARTSLHLAELSSGHRNFIRGSLGDILRGRIAPRSGDSPVTIFSPFGLGILDIAVAAFVLEKAREEGRGRTIPSFFPGPVAREQDQNGRSPQTLK